MDDYKYGHYGRPIPSYNEEKSKTSLASDHKCRPVFVDSEGRKRPVIILPGNTETYVTRTETYVEEDYSSSEDEYQHGYTTKYEPVKYHGHLHDKGNRNSSPARDRPAEVGNFITKIQTEASQPIKYPPSPTYRRQSPHLRVRDGNDNDFDHHCDYNKKTVNKPSESSSTKWHNKRHDDHNSDDDDDDSDEEPYLIMSYGRTKPNRATGFAPHAHDAIHKPVHGVGTMEPKAKSTNDWSRPSHAAAARDAKLSAPMNDVEKAIEYFKDAVILQSGKRAPNSKNATNSPKKGGDTQRETIDSKEAARRYGNFRPSYPLHETYTSTIDSREAARKYNGTTV